MCIRDRYKALEDIFARNPETLFIFVTAPPECWADADSDNAKRAREFNDWLTYHWIEYYQMEHPGLNNLVVYNWFGFLANPNTDIDEHANMLKEKYGGDSGDSHPNRLANIESNVSFATGEYNLIDWAWEYFTAID